jgi:hypothetical protein
MPNMTAQVIDDDQTVVTINHPNGAVSEVTITLFPAGGTHIVIEASQSNDCTVDVGETTIADLEAGR